ncbi:MAG: polyribonucleotide nucleotidyltransferase [Candidatus Zambryskibacteria bacterium RIFCSPHIGHO2_01_FULL_43_25]|uniref:Polyribonucleotide nucleotidyltransferase n=1 Tax=Candidatus Zambryskibacteria bacterium RIFCSPLOWO2_01_FULL_45_21 TaxID=1802761 RepID=A0A1G2U2D7_9BACT|nr:MAG: polyribonucleotide nucleotidyltransferase [Candidatus Zambryskibacteria bacterium RIFCSPHIGHO2_01_FULL_43_25]OHB00979.1 MAG: polyribonucleotide nucleotidyltransferase [Candidatus Zambryskibacteria bacterium RIFCSPHIGHO2_12_FULL_44_12b]OHB03695.1 MAG: polyribonucleotide nucleotidyltransferase [Candidatus Zambryskibacteria bacterium RIFCSPLOWO2_01_FULL_45_21]
MTAKTYKTQFGGKELKIEFNDIVDQAHGSCLVHYGDTVVLATAVMGREPKEGADFFPLTVDFEEKFYATGKILGSRFQKREGRPTDDAVLSGRIVDRAIRPLFDSWVRNEIQIVVTVLSIGEDDPDILSVLAASLAIGTSHIPWNGPLGAVRIGKAAGGMTINPTYTVRNGDDYNLDLLACGRDGKINMIEIGSSEVGEEDIIEALKLAQAKLAEVQAFQEKIIKEMGKEKVKLPKPATPKRVIELFQEKIQPIFRDKIFSGSSTKEDLSDLNILWREKIKILEDENERNLAVDYLEERINEEIHNEIIDKKRRSDGRGMDEIRPLFARAGGISKILHGAGLFYRGGTHVLSVLTLGGPGDAQLIDGMETKTEKRFMLHYNFPPYSVGEVGRMSGTNRRMIGHGALAEKALIPVLPKKENFPYTIRLVAESMASNGSTSMASVCAGTIALMDGGVPIVRPVAGIASGLMMRDEDNFVVLTDIHGPEDHHGDMDLKIAGTELGVTAVQMDVKVAGIPVNILKIAFDKAKAARLQILKFIAGEISAPREQISEFAPRIAILKIKQDQIGLVIGTGGKTINDIKDKTETEIDIEEDGTVYITGKKDGVEKAQKIIEEMTHEFAVGDRMRAEVVKITEFGAFVRVNGGTEGLVHISEIAPRRLKTVDELLRVGDVVPVVVKEIDERGRLKFSIKDIDPNWFDKVGKK